MSVELERPEPLLDIDGVLFRVRDVEALIHASTFGVSMATGHLIAFYFHAIIAHEYGHPCARAALYGREHRSA